MSDRWGAGTIGLCMVAAAVGVTGCPDTDPEGEECDSPGDPCSPVIDSETEGSYARACILTDDPDTGEAELQCRNVCDAPGEGYGDGEQLEGDLCEHDPDCAEETYCDNDVSGGSATCRCLTDEPGCETDLVVGRVMDFEGASCPGSFLSALFDVSMTCQTDDLECEERRLTLGFAQDLEDLSTTCFGISDCDTLPEGCTSYVGELCGSEFVWQEDPDRVLGTFERGVIHFSAEDRFDLNMTSHPSPSEPATRSCTANGRLQGSGDLDDPRGCDEYFPFGLFECDPGALAPGEPRPGEGAPPSAMCAYELHQCPEGCSCEGEGLAFRACEGAGCTFRAPCEIDSDLCVDDLDVAGVWEEDYFCYTGVPPCESTRVTFRLTQHQNQVRIEDLSSDGSWVGYGYLCGNVLHWFARAATYYEYGFWYFDTDDMFYKTSAYRTYGGSDGGDCIGVGWRDGDEPIGMLTPEQCE